MGATAPLELHVEVRFHIHLVQIPRIVPVDDHLRRVSASPEQVLIGLHQAEIDIRFVDDADGLAGAVYASLVERSQIVLGLKVLRRDRELIGV